MIPELFNGTQRWILKLWDMLIKLIEELWFPHNFSNDISSPLFEIRKEYIKADFM